MRYWEEFWHGRKGCPAQVVAESPSLEVSRQRKDAALEELFMVNVVGLMVGPEGLCDLEGLEGPDDPEGLDGLEVLEALPTLRIP